MIRYDRLWATMEAKGITQYRLIKQHSFSAGQIGRLKKNMHVSTHTLDTLCTILNCDISDIIEYIPEGMSPAPKAAEETVVEAVVEAEASEAPSADKKAASPETPSAGGNSSPLPKSRKDEPPKAEKPKKSGKSKKGDKKAAKDSKKGKDSKKNK